MVTPILEELEGLFVHRMKKSSVDTIEVSNRDPLSFDGDFHPLDILPKCDNIPPSIELEIHKPNPELKRQRHGS